jgi:hypothetical protein
MFLWSLVFGIGALPWGFHSIVRYSFGFDVGLEVMKAIGMALAVSLVLVLAGCATHQGGAIDEYGTSANTINGNPGSPTFRPGMNPNDIRDPNALTQPHEPSPTSPP